MSDARKKMGARQRKLFTATLPAQPDREEITLHLRQLNALEETKYHETLEQIYPRPEDGSEPVVTKRRLNLHYITLVVFATCQEDGSRMFDPENPEDLREVGQWYFEDLELIFKAYHETIDPPRTQEELKQEAKKSETTEPDASPSSSVSAQEELIPISS